MTKEEKELLVGDLFARLPYEVKCNINGELCEIARVDVERQQLYLKKADGHGGTYSIARGDVPKPYLRPLESMTEAERDECMPLFDVMDDDYIPHEEWSYRAFDWYNRHHFDYRELIGKGLALEAPDGMYGKKI